MIETSNLVLEFWETCIHQILFTRNIYPEVIFEARSKYGVNVWQSVHPEINTYIQRVLLNTKTMLEKGLAARLVVTFKSPAMVTVECFSLSSDTQSQISADQLSTSLDDLENQFRAMLLKISLVGAQLSRLPDDCSFVLHIATTECHDSEQQSCLESAIRSGEWLVENDQLPETLAKASSSGTGRASQIVPVKHIAHVSFVNQMSINVYKF